MARQERKSTEIKDEILFARFKKGDQEAFNEILMRYQAPIMTYIVKSTGNKEKAEEVFQDVFFKVVDRREQFKTKVSFKAWLYTIARTTCIDAARKRQRTPYMSSIYRDDEEQRDEKLESQEPSAQDLTHELQIDGQLKEALDEIAPEQKETFVLKVMHEMTFEEIAVTMKCSVNTAKSRMRYALEKLRTILKKRNFLADT